MQNSKKLKISKHIIKGSLTGVIILVVSLFIAASMILKTTINSKYYLLIFALCLILSGFLSGLSASLKQKNKGIINGVSASLLAAAAALTAVSITEKSVSLVSLIVPVIVMISGAIGGITAINMKIKRKRR